MAEGNIGSYHLADNPAIYEPARSNTFEFVVTGLNNIARVDDADEVITNAEDVLRYSVAETSIPHFSLSTLEIRRGNSVMKFAGVPSFNAGNLVINDYIGADGKSALMAWQGKAYNVRTEKVGKLADYKKQCWLIEYDPAFNFVRQWRLEGCWISAISESPFNMEASEVRKITATVEYDKAYMELDQTVTVID